MVDSHLHPADWGIMPILFHINNLALSSYTFFVFLGLVVGIIVYFYESRKQKKLSDNGIYVAVGALVGGTIGAKVLEIAINYDFFIKNIGNPSVFISGRTIVGGLIGGTVGAILTKRILGIKEKRGNLFAPAIAIGVAIGRLGCFFVGCCYGKATNLPWGVDFGDHIPRHPTQIYESLFMLGMFVYLEKIKNRSDVKPGQLFKLLMVSYFTFRFVIEFIRVEPVTLAGLTTFQFISVVVILYLVKNNVVVTFIKVKKYVSRLYASNK